MQQSAGQETVTDLSGDLKAVKIGQKEYSPFLNRGYPLRVYWGDTHLHTSYSTDAGMFGNRLGPEEAYRFARGEEVVSGPGGNNLHRNVIYRNGKINADRVLPISNYDSSDPENLWQWMADAETKTGSRLLALAHNGNLSNGLMFDDVTLTDGNPHDRPCIRRLGF